MNIVIKYILMKLGEVSFEIIGVTTKGDKEKNLPLHEIGVKGLFEKEVNLKVLEGEADIAVHSMKDLPSKLPNGLEIVMIPPRGPREDALLPRMGLPVLCPRELPQGTIVAAGSLRRRNALVHEIRNIKTTWIRGNLDTRIRKLDEGNADYLVIAEAGLQRLAVKRPRRILPPEKYVPSPGQGLIAVVALSDTLLARKLRKITSKYATIEALAERSFLSKINAGCSAPIGGTAWYTNGEIKFIAANYSLELPSPRLITVKGKDPVEVGEEAANLLRAW